MVYQILEDDAQGNYMWLKQRKRVLLKREKVKQQRRSICIRTYLQDKNKGVEAKKKTLRISMVTLMNLRKDMILTKL
jgi:hypothetical protein